jgi:hypothetical protein
VAHAAEMASLPEYTRICDPRMQIASYPASFDKPQTISKSIVGTSLDKKPSAILTDNDNCILRV